MDDGFRAVAGAAAAAAAPATAKAAGGWFSIELTDDPLGDGDEFVTAAAAEEFGGAALGLGEDLGV